MQDFIEIIEQKLYFVTNAVRPKSSSGILCISSDQEFTYNAYNKDFGPLSLSSIYRFCYKLNNLLSSPHLESSQIHHTTGVSSEKQANAILLMGAFQILALGRSAEASWLPFSHLPVLPFRDAGQDKSMHDCSVLHCLKAIERAVRLDWFSITSFDLKFYEKHSYLENGDFNWIVPQKLMAFSNPSCPHRLATEFTRLGISAVVRLNDKTYDASVFKNRGIQHYELFFPDGTCPSPRIVRQFLKICQQETAVAVHCRAGLGRTGTLIGCYAIKERGIPANEFIAWARLCRPGCVIGQQQLFLIEYQKRVVLGIEHTLLPQGDEDIGQAIRLMNAKGMFKTEDNRKKLKSRIKSTEKKSEPVESPRKSTPYRSHVKNSYVARSQYMQNFPLFERQKKSQ